MHEEWKRRKNLQKIKNAQLFKIKLCTCYNKSFLRGRKELRNVFCVFSNCDNYMLSDRGPLKCRNWNFTRRCTAVTHFTLVYILPGKFEQVSLSTKKIKHNCSRNWNLFNITKTVFWFLKTKKLFRFGYGFLLQKKKKMKISGFCHCY